MPTRQEYARAVVSRTNFYAYCQFVHEVALAPHQLEWVKILQSEAPEHKKVAISAPPEFWKSRVLRMFIEWSIGRNPEWCRLLAMNTDAQATKQLRSVQDTIVNNEKYHWTFPDVKPDYKRGWNAHHLYVIRKNSARPEPTLMASGVMGAIQGAHFEEIYTDDVTDQPDVNSPTTMQNQRDWVKGVLWDRFRRDEEEVPIGHWFAIFTRWGDKDLWDTFTKEPDGNSPDGGLGFTAISNPAVLPPGQEYPWGGRLLWPGEYSEKRLDTIRSIKGSDLFTMTYLCDPSAMGGNILPIKLANRFDMSSPPEFDFVLHSWDCATGDSSDASFSVCTEISRFGRGFAITHVFKDRLRQSQLIDMIYRFRQDRRPNIVLLEDRGSGQSVIAELESDDTPPLSELRATDPKGFGDKIARARAQQTVLENGMLWIPEKAPWLADWLSEIAAFPAGAFDDQVDSLTQGLAFLRGEKLPRRRSYGGTSWMNRRPANRQQERRHVARMF